MASEEPISLLENQRQRGRKKLKITNEKKIKKEPLRGMGVAKLERLLSGQPEPSPPAQQPPILPSGHHQFFLPAPYPDLTGGGYGGYGQLGFNQALFLQRLGYGDHGSGSDQSRVGFGGKMDLGLRGSYLGENSKELSSILNPVYHPADQCSHCHKGQKIRGNADPSLIHGFGFNGLNVRNKQHIDGINIDHKGVEAVGIHRKGSSGGVFMEYDFFPPGKVARSTSTNELDLSLFSEASVAALGGGEGSCVTTASTSIDLSLKLSC